MNKKILLALPALALLLTGCNPADDVIPPGPGPAEPTVVTFNFAGLVSDWGEIKTAENPDALKEYLALAAGEEGDLVTGASIVAGRLFAGDGTYGNDILKVGSGSGDARNATFSVTVSESFTKVSVDIKSWGGTQGTELATLSVNDLTAQTVSAVAADETPSTVDFTLDAAATTFTFATAGQARALYFSIILSN